MKPSKKIAITGGIGSGKSVLCAILREMGYPVFSCDEIYARLCGEADYIALIEKRFPACVKDGSIDKKALSRLVFADETARNELNGLSHPRIMARLLEQMAGHQVAFAEVPLLYEGGFEGLFDGVIAVIRDKSARVSAVSARSGLSEGEILARMAAQLDEGVYRERGAYLIVNDGSLDDLRQSAQKLIEHFGI